MKRAKMMAVERDTTMTAILIRALERELARMAGEP